MESTGGEGQKCEGLSFDSNVPPDPEAAELRDIEAEDPSDDIERTSSSSPKTEASCSARKELSPTELCEGDADTHSASTLHSSRVSLLLLRLPPSLAMLCKMASRKIAGSA